MQKNNGQNGGFHSEYCKLDRFLSVINLNKKSIDVNQLILFLSSIELFFFFVQYIVQRMTFDELLNSKAPVREQLLYDAGTTESERKDFRNALTALKDCIGI